MTLILKYLDYAFLALGGFAGLYASLYYVHMLQLESYQANMFSKWLLRNAWRRWLPTVLIFIICICLDIAIYGLRMGETITSDAYRIAQAVVRVLYIAMLFWISGTWRRRPAKKPLVYTGRVKRLIVAITLVIMLLHTYPLMMTFYDNTLPMFLVKRGSAYLTALLLPLIILFAHFLVLPIEELNKRRYFNDAKRRIRERQDLVKIGITGSYGKTSTKFILGTLLSEKYNTLVTPSSFNTPMGITRVIREKLEDAHEVFVAEMGARYVGDIAELCDLVAPKIGLLTSVGKQHLETFGSLHNIMETKYELIRSLPNDGAAFFNGDNAICRELFERTSLEKKFLYGIDSLDDLYMRASRIKAGAQGSTFTLTADDESVQCTTPILGKHNILNIAGCAAIALHLGLSLEEIAAGIAKLQPVEHRLQLIPGAVTVIDDAFNANPDGTKAAMEVLRSFDGRKIVVTPGLVELGEEEDAQNEAFGREIAVSADYAILVGKRRAAVIARGIESMDFPKENIFIVSTLDQATSVLSHLTGPGDVVLFENDLPDNYNE